MTVFEEIWYVKYMNNLVTLDTLKKLVKAEKLEQTMVDAWITERLEKHGY